MLTNISARFALLFFVALGCATEDGNPPAPPGTSPLPEETGTTDSDPSFTGGESSTGGEMCMDEWATYQCYGWVAGIHSNDLDSSNTQFFVNGDLFAVCDVREIEIPFVGMDVNNPTVEMACRESCQNDVGDIEWDSASSGWSFEKNVCVYAHNGNNGTVPNPTDGITNLPSGAAGLCDNIGSVLGPVLTQNYYIDGLNGPTCAEIDCSDWDPTSEVTYRYNASTKTHTVDIEGDFLDAMLADFGNDLYGCDAARWRETTVTGGAKKWKATGVAVGDFMYTIGLRTNDYQMRIRKMYPSTSAWINLDSWEHNAQAISLFATKTQLRVEFRRPKTAPSGYDTHVMLVTII